MTVCHVVTTGSRPITEVKQRRARSVVRWVTAVKTGLTGHLLTVKRLVLYISREPDIWTYRCCNLESPRQSVRYSPWSRGAGLKLSPVVYLSPLTSGNQISPSSYKCPPVHREAYLHSLLGYSTSFKCMRPLRKTKWKSAEIWKMCYTVGGNVNTPPEDRHLSRYL
jgi:hypothetical protein